MYFILNNFCFSFFSYLCRPICSSCWWGNDLRLVLTFPPLSPLDDPWSNHLMTRNIVDVLLVLYSSHHHLCSAWLPRSKILSQLIFCCNHSILTHIPSPLQPEGFSERDERKNDDRRKKIGICPVPVQFKCKLRYTPPACVLSSSSSLNRSPSTF